MIDEYSLWKELDINLLIHKANPSRMKPKTRYPIKIVRIVEGRFYENGCDLYIDKIDDLVKLTGYNTVIRSDIQELQRILLQWTDKKTLKAIFEAKTHQVKINNIGIMSTSKNDDYFVFQKSNQFGRIYCFDEYMEINDAQLKEEIEASLDACDDLGWKLNCFMPSQKMAMSLLSSKANSSLMPNIKHGDIPLEHLRRMVECNKGGLIELCKSHAYKSLYIFDMNTAYFSPLPDLFAMSPEFVNFISDDKWHKEAIAWWMYARARVQPGLPISPLLKRMGPQGFGYHNFGLLTADGIWITNEIMPLVRLGIIEIEEIYEATWAIPKQDSIPHIFSGVSHTLTQLANNSNRISKYIVKNVGTKFWGKLREDLYGSKFTQPNYSSLISEHIRTALMLTILMAGDHAVFCATDSLGLDKHMSLTISDKVGDWKYDIVDLTPYTEVHRDRSDRERSWYPENGYIVNPPRELTVKEIINDNMPNNADGYRFKAGPIKRQFNGLLTEERLRNDVTIYKLPKDEEDGCELYLNKGTSWKSGL